MCCICHGNTEDRGGISRKGVDMKLPNWQIEICPICGNKYQVDLARQFPAKQCHRCSVRLMGANQSLKSEWSGVLRMGKRIEGEFRKTALKAAMRGGIDPVRIEGY